MIDTSLLYEQKPITLDKKECFLDTPLSFRTLKNCVVAGETFGGVFDENKCFIDGTGLHSGDNRPAVFDESKNIVVSPDKIIYLGAFIGVWGHVITDCISRVWFLKELRKQFPDHKLCYVPFHNFEFKGTITTIFEYLGVSVNELHEINGWQEFSEIIIPDRCFDSRTGFDRYFTPEYVELINQIKSHAKSNDKLNFKKVFLTYANFKKWKTHGEKKLEKFFKEQGYEIIAPEKYTFDEQLSIFANCECLASTIGSCAHNSIFLREKANLILIPRGNYVTEYQSTLNHVNDLNVTYIDSHLSVFTSKSDPWVGPYYYYVSENLLSYFGYDRSYYKDYIKYNFKDFKKYTLAALKHGTLTNHQECETYENILTAYLKEQKENSFIQKLKNIVKRILKK